METKSIITVNNADILVSNDEERMVPIRPICQALGIDPEGQRQRIERDPILGSRAFNVKAVALDGRVLDMYAIPIRFVFGWLFSIDTSKVNAYAQEAVINYKLECYNALFDYFSDRATFIEQKQNEIDKQLTVVEKARAEYRNAKSIMTEAENRLNKLRTMTMDDYDRERRQLNLDF